MILPACEKRHNDVLSGGSPYLIDSMLLLGRQEDTPVHVSSYIPLRLLKLIEDLKQQYPAEQRHKFSDMTQMLRAVCLVRHDKGATPLQSRKTRC
jgi:hypothetical protein